MPHTELSPAALEAQYPSLEVCPDLDLQDLTRLEDDKLYAAGMQIVQGILHEMSFSGRTTGPPPPRTTTTTTTTTNKCKPSTTTTTTTATITAATSTAATKATLTLRTKRDGHIEKILFLLPEEECSDQHCLRWVRSK